ncbi:MAG: hypothetical protein JSS69_04335 [Acidobacteria bacterium]|nr:hypothetical protein [Acidobacteriota bacterium]MBS1865124.1 hypothetical protein [Acidobacteriota bacterium]
MDGSAIYAIPAGSRIELRRGDVQITLEEGRIGFFSAIEGRVTGAVFSGRAHILAVPRDPVEKQQLALFTGAPILDQSVTSAYFRFTDGTDAELLRQFRSAGISAHDDLNFVSRWDAILPGFNPLHSLRILSELLTENIHPYFYAAMEGLSTGPFDLVFDTQREEPVFLGQAHKAQNDSFYDVWVSYRLPDSESYIPSFRPVSYSLDTKIQPDMTLSASAALRIRAVTGGERFLPLQLSRDLQIKSVTLGGQSLEFFQNEGMSAQQRESQGNDVLAVILPVAPKKDDEVLLTFEYSGKVIRDSGNGVFFVDARENWFPHIGGAADFALYEITMRWPRKLKLAATGTKLDEKEEGEFRIGHWKTETPAAVAGFNLGEYAFASVAGTSYSVDVYANRQLEMALERRIHSPEDDFGESIAIAHRSAAGSSLSLPSTQPSPADALKHLAREIDSSIHFYEGYAGPFPFRQLAVSQIPGTFGQGWPGLLYLSTYSFLPAAAQEQAGLSTASQEHFSELVPFHEVAHQWWGNVVGWPSYRDQWIDEALANYFALLFADSQKTPDRKMHIWLERYRNRLEEKLRDSQLAAADIGSLALGSRLSSSKAPDGFEILIYSKGSWTIHMIREMLRQPGSKNPDARFQAFLKNLFVKYSYKGLSTEDLLHELNAVMTPAMDLDGNHTMEWFIEDWVRGVGIPHYYAEYAARRTERGFQVKGKLYQSRVPHGFVASVPIYSAGGVFLGRVIAGGAETQFHFNAAADPGKLQIDPHMTLLCVVDKEKPKAAQN